MDQQSDISGLIPKGLGAYWLLFILGVLSIAGLEYAYYQESFLAAKLGVERLTALDVGSSQSIFNWGLSICFFVTAVVALANYRLGRKHKDPAFRVNAWFWAAAALTFLSMDVQVGVRDAFREVLINVSGTPLYKDGAVWWLGAYVFLFGLIGGRLLPDLASYTPSMGFFLLAVAGAITGLVMDHGPVLILLKPTETVMVHTSIKAVAALFLLLAFALFARRQVFRDPDIALRWFKKIWEQPSEKKSETTTPAKPVIKPLPIPVVPPKPAPTAEVGSGIILPKDRPVIQKREPDVQESKTVPFVAAVAESENDEDFELANIA